MYLQLLALHNPIKDLTKTPRRSFLSQKMQNNVILHIPIRNYLMRCNSERILVPSTPIFLKFGKEFSQASRKWSRIQKSFCSTKNISWFIIQTTRQSLLKYLLLLLAVQNQIKYIQTRNYLMFHNRIVRRA